MRRVLCALLTVVLLLTGVPGLDGIEGNAARAAAPRVVQIAAGDSHSLALLSDGRLYAWGDNWGGQLGDGTTTDRHTPVLIGTGYTAISAGHGHSFALKDGALYAWGGNYDGQLGDGTTTDRHTPTLIGAGYTAISAGLRFSLALKGSALYAWGNNYAGQLGDGTTMNRHTPTLIGAGYTAIAAGGGHSFALKNGALYAWGDNDDGQLGDGTTTRRYTPMLIGAGYTAISAGNNQSLALKNGALYAWGCNDNGRLGDGTETERHTPTLIGAGYTAIAAGTWHSLALKNGALYAWGDNHTGQLGDGTTRDRHTPVLIGAGYTAIAAGVSHSLALKDGALYAWGYNRSGQLGDGTATDRHTPTRITFFDSLTAQQPVPATGIKISPEKLTLYVGGVWPTLKATVSPNGASQKVTWSSSNDKVASVNSEGVVKGLKAGKATITAKTANGKTGQCAITVKFIEAKSITMKKKLSIYPTEEQRLFPEVMPLNASTKEVKWHTSNASIASVDQQGRITGKKAGTAAITATSKSNPKVKAVCKVSVKKAPAYRALSIGQYRYANSTMHEATLNDIVLMQGTFAVSSIYGKKYAKNERKNSLTTKEMVRQIKAMHKWGATKDDVTVFYYTGHGSVRGITGVDETFLTWKELKKLLDPIKGKKILLIHSCHSGASIGKSDAGGGETMWREISKVFAGGPRGKTLNAGDYYVLASSKGSESSYNAEFLDAGKQRSIYTYFLCMAGGFTYKDINNASFFTEADKNKDKRISLGEAYDVICTKMAKAYPEAYQKQHVQIYQSGSDIPLFGRK